jgi:hypothetical protein
MTSPVNFHRFSFSQWRRIGIYHDLWHKYSGNDIDFHFRPMGRLHSDRVTSKTNTIPYPAIAAHLIPQAVPSPRNLVFTTLPLNPIALTICGSPGTRSMA